MSRRDFEAPFYASLLIRELVKPACYGRAEVVGSIRRGAKKCNDIDILCEAEYDVMVDHLNKMAEAPHILSTIHFEPPPDSQETPIPNYEPNTIVCQIGRWKVNFMLTDEGNWGGALAMWTGPRTFNHWVANKLGVKWREVARVAMFKTEEDLFEALGIDFVAPLDRERYAEGWRPAPKKTRRWCRVCGSDLSRCGTFGKTWVCLNCGGTP